MEALPIQYQLPIKTVREQLHEIKGKSDPIQSMELEILNKTEEKIHSGCREIMSLLSSYEVNQPNSFPPEVKLKVQALNNDVVQMRNLADIILSRMSDNLRFYE